MENIGAKLRWWLIVCLQLLTISIAVFFGFHEILWESDQTKISFLIISLWAATTAAIGWWHFYKDSTSIHSSAKIGWFLAETSLALGMLGTVTGFLLMLGTAFTSIDVSDVNTLQAALSGMASGMATALYTTLVGIVISIFIKVQLVNLENLADRNG